jgi:hypothetical protein
LFLACRFFVQGVLELDMRGTVVKSGLGGMYDPALLLGLPPGALERKLLSDFLDQG